MKTFKEIDIKYYDNSGNVQVRCTVPVTQEALVHYELMQSHYCKLSFKLSRPTYFLLGDFIETPYGRFELIDLTKAKDNDTIGYSYEIQFDAYYRKLKNKILKYRPNTGSQEATFSLTSKISTHIEVIMKNLAYYAKLDKSYLYDPNFEGEGTDYTYVIDASVDANAAKLITYSNSSILDAIANIAQTFGCEWWFEGNILHFGTCENTNAITDFRLNDNIVSMSSSQSQSTYANRVYAFGAARNLPSGYKNDSDADITKDGVVEKRLMLPTSAECSEQNKQMLAENGFELKNGYIQVGGLREDQYVEGVTTNDDIYPRNLIKTSKVTSYEKDVEDESTPEEGDYIKRTFYRVNSLTIVNEDGEKTGDMAFRKAYILSGKNLHIVFQSGSLNGMDFECEFNPDGVPEILLDDDGNPIFKDGKEQINPKSQVFEIVANEDYGRFLPDTTLHPKDGDTFVLYNWNSTKLGDALVPSASNELLADAIKNLKKSVIDPTTYTCTAEDNYSYNHGRGNLHGVGDRVNLYNKGYGDGYRSSRVIGYEFSLDIPFDGAKYYVGEKPSYSRLNAMESKIEELIYNGQSYLNGNGGSGRSIYIIKSYDSITPTDYNVFSAKAVDEQRLNKTKDDTAKGTITWEKVQKLLSGLLVGNSNFENGGSWTPDTEGRSHLITDYLEVRMKAIFEELVVKKTSTIGGKEIISPAGGVVAHKVEDVTVTYNNVSQKAYRCYFLAEQEGDAVDNDFSVNDQVRSESFNVRKGTYHKVGNHFYWRLVIGRNEDPVELEGKKYHYIDLSDTDCATASDVPAKGDVLNQCGNRTDVERQNCLIFSAVDTYSPSVSLYHGINSYSFANKEYVECGVNKQTNKAFFNVYGDMYVGDRPTKENGYEGSSYVKYDSATKQVVIKGKLSAKSTVDGKELSQYIKENSAKGLTEEQVNNLIKNSQVIADLQNQVDGAIETWFYEGVPTLKNAPASSWTTDKDKDTHLGDLYYDNKTGKAYRFAKDGNTYKWTIITDTDIAKALSDASKAQETADGKMKVFSTQPIPPYQVGDIWVNATYPTDGSTYKNEVLRCQTAKGAGSQFAIGDWIKASKYTDDTVANAAKAAAEKAQKAAEKAQGDISKLGTTVTTNKKAFDNYVKDGYLEPSEIAAMAQDSKRLEDAFAAAEKSYNEVKGAEVLKDTKELSDLNAAFATLTTAKKELITYLSDISTRYNAADTNGKATIVSAVGTKFTNFQSAYSAFYDKLGLANAYITSKIYGDLKQNITDLAGYKYIKDALGQTTDIDGGLVMTTLLALRDAEGNVQSGINGAIDPNRGKKSIATWWGGRMVDKDYNSGNLTPATSLVRFDGSGYLANGAIWWDVDGKVHADPTSFIISEKNLGAYLTFFEPTWKAGSAGTSVADLVSLKPNAPFTKLGVSGDATFEGAITFHGIKLEYDAANKAIKIDGNLYATGGITAYGASSVAGGGGLNASVISYARILEGNYTDADLTSIPNAYAIKAISSRIDNIATELGSLSLSWNNITGKPSTFAPSAHTHKWAEITDRITKVSQLTNDAGYLTTHQSLASYYTKAEIDAKGYTTNKGTVTSVGLTLPTGLTCATKTITTSGTFAISFASGYSIPTTAKQTAWDGAVSAKHTHSNKSVLDGISSTKVSHWDSAYGWYALMTTDEETADGIINKWNEVVSFLANIAQTDTLSGIVDGINKSISDEVARAKKAEGVNASGISTNKTNITTLQGYFTSGSAKKALQLTNARKLWGNSFNGTSDINGSIIVPSGKYISIGNIKLEYDAANKAIKIDGNLYATGGITAYGASSVAGGGGLNASVISYARILEGNYTDADLTSIPNAYAIKAISSRIDNIATELGSLSLSWNNITGKPSTFAPSAHTHKWAEITDRITKVSQLTNDAGYLTTHQSLASYYTKAEIDAKGYTTNKGTVTSVGLTLPTGLTCATKTITTSGTFAISFASGYSIPTTAKQTAWDGAVSAKHTHSNKSVLDGISSTKVSHWDSAYGWYALMTTDEETADGIINKWNEVVSFLANIAQTDTLSGIVDGINKSISDEVARAKKAEGVNASGISTNKTNITTLQGYFTSGSAKKALQLTNARKLWGNSFNGTSDINGSIIVPSGKYISIGNIKLEYDAANKALKITNTTTEEVANLYTSGGVSAYGVGTSSSSGGGLNGSVKAYADAIRLTTENLSEIASAYSIKALDSRIVSLEGGSAMDVSVSGSGNAVTAISKSGTTISVTKGTTFLTSHQSLDGYVNEVATSGTGNAITLVSKSGKKLTFTKGATFLTSHQSLSAYLKSADAANTYLKLSGGAMTGNISYKGSKNTYDMITFVDNNVDIYGNGICIGGGGLTIIGGGESASEVLKQHTNGGDENMIIANDAAIDFFSNMNSGWASRKVGSFDVSGYWNGVGFKKNNSSDNYVLTGGGGHKAISTLSVSYASSAGSANSVAWSNVSGRPTKVSQFTNDSNYATQSWVTGKGYLTSHQDISGKVNRTGDYLDTDSDRWWLSNSEFGINLHNSDIVGVNSIYTSDVSNGPKESISFKRSNGNYDTLRMADGVIWFGTDYAVDKTINEYQILHTNNIRMSLTSDGFINMSVGGVQKQAYIYAIGSIDGYNNYPDGRTTSINDYTKGLNRLFLTHATSSLQSSQRPLGNDGHILHFGWDNNSGWDAQLAITANGDKPYIAVRAQYSGTWRNWYGAALLKCTNYISGNGGLLIERTDKDLDTYIGVINGKYDIRLMIGSGNVNRGIYDVATGNWMLYRDASTNIYMNGSVLASGGITAYTSSDIRLKQDLRKLDYFGIIKAMGGTFGFAWKKDNTRSIGWIAQHVLRNPHLKDIVETDEKGYYKINYWSPKLIATAFGAIEQVGDEVSRLKARVVFLESEVQRLSGKQGSSNKKRLDNKNINLLN